MPPLYATTRLRAVTRTSVPVTSALTVASVAVKVGLRTEGLGGGPRPPDRRDVAGGPQGARLAAAAQQHGPLDPRAARHPTPLSGDRSRYRFTVRRGSRARTYRVAVVARDGGAHVPGTSRAVTLRRR